MEIIETKFFVLCYDWLIVGFYPDPQLTVDPCKLYGSVTLQSKQIKMLKFQTI